MNEWMHVAYSLQIKRKSAQKDNIKPVLKKSTRNNDMHRIKAILKRDMHANGPNVRFIMAP